MTDYLGRSNPNWCKYLVWGECKISEDYKKIKKLEQTIRTLKEPDYDVLNSFMDFLYNDDNISCSALVEISELIDKYRSK